MREIRVAGFGGGSRVGAPLQTEALAYFGRMTTPSPAFRDAMNWAIWRWKQAGLWPLIKGLWFHAADTEQAALLSVIGDTPRDATLTGAPAFTALKGFGPLNAGGQVVYPITAGAIGGGQPFHFTAGVWNPKLNAGVEVVGTFIQSDAGTGTSHPGHFGLYGASPNVGLAVAGAPNMLMFHNASVTNRLVVGAKGFTLIAPGMNAGGSGSLAAVSSNYRTVASAYSPIDRHVAYGFLAEESTTRQCSKFLAILADLAEQLGALD